MINSSFHALDSLFQRPLLAAAMCAAFVFFIMAVLALAAALISGLVKEKKQEPVPAQRYEPQPEQAEGQEPRPCVPQLVLEDVDEQSAAILMAITAHKCGIPLERLKFNSIRLIKDESEEDGR